VSDPLPDALQRSRREIDRALDDAWTRLLPRLTARDARLAPLAEQLAAFSEGGKRLRPALLLLGFEASGGRTRSAVHGPALALELLHTCALAHDDVIDRAPTRRGRPTLHRAFATQHRDEGWEGEPAAYGDAVAILVGDLAFVHADELFLEASVPDRALLAAFRRFTTMREEVMVGQYLDLYAATSRTTDRELALRVASLKSGRYSVARPLELGAVLAEAPPELADGLRAVGEPLGRAFQLRDDLLGVFGTEASTGKSTSSDLAEGKRTLLVAEAAARLDPADRAELEAGLGDPTLDAARADRLRTLLIDSGARAATEAAIDDAVHAAERALGELTLPPAPAAALRELAGYVGVRST
jgi:geranylgeranyl diphosphate synthase, type I